MSFAGRRRQESEDCNLEVDNKNVIFEDKVYRSPVLLGWDLDLFFQEKGSIMIIDGKNAILGRLASHTAKKLLSGEEVTIVNADGIIITGEPKRIVEKYIKLRRIGSPQHGPFLPTKSEALVRRTVRSMMPYKTNKGRVAFKKLRVYADSNGMKDEQKQNDAQSASSVYVKTIKSNYITMGEVSKILGGKR